MKTKVFAVLVIAVAALALFASVAPGYGQTATNTEVQPVAVVTPAPPAKPVVSAAGTWEGKLNATFFRGEPDITLRLEEKGEGVVEGDFDSGLVRRGQTIRNAPLKGRITEGVLTLKDQTLPFGGITATIDGNKMKGVFRGDSGRPFTLEAERK